MFEAQPFAPLPVGGTPTPPQIPQVTQFLNRVTLSSADQALYATFITTLVNAGIWNTGDVCHIGDAAILATTLQNLISSSYTATQGATPTFSPSSGWGTSNTANPSINSPFDPGVALSSNFSTNCGCLIVGILSARQDGVQYNIAFGQGGNTNVNPNNNGGGAAVYTFNGGYPGFPNVSGTSQGFWAVNRPPTSTGNRVEFSRNTVNLFANPNNSSNNPASSGSFSFNSSPDVMNFIWIGGALTNAQMAILQNAANAFFGARSGNNYYPVTTNYQPFSSENLAYTFSGKTTLPPLGQNFHQVADGTAGPPLTAPQINTMLAGSGGVIGRTSMPWSSVEWFGPYAASSATANTSNVAHVASSTFVANGMVIANITNPAAIPDGTTVTGVSGGNITMSNNAAGVGIAPGDLLAFYDFVNANGGYGVGPDALVNGTVAAGNACCLAVVYGNGLYNYSQATPWNNQHSFPPNEYTTSVTSNSIPTLPSGNMTWTTDGTLGLSAGTKVAIQQHGSPANYIWGTVVSNTGLTLVIAPFQVGGSGTAITNWDIIVEGPNGGYSSYSYDTSNNYWAAISETTSSSTSVTIPSSTGGSFTWTTTKALGLPIGASVYVGATSNPSVNFIQGTVTSNTGTSLTITCTAFGGSGTFSGTTAWTIYGPGPVSSDVPGSAAWAWLQVSADITLGQLNGGIGNMPNLPGKGNVSVAAYASIFRAMMYRYGVAFGWGPLIIGELWNEENLFWNNQANPRDWTALANASISQGLAANPGAIIITGGASPGPGYANGDSAAWYTACLTGSDTHQPGAGTYTFTPLVYNTGLSGFGFHPYTGGDGAGSNYNESFFDIQNLQAAVASYTVNGAPLPIWCTEDGFAIFNNVTNGAQWLLTEQEKGAVVVMLWMNALIAGVSTSIQYQLCGTSVAEGGNEYGIYNASRNPLNSAGTLSAFRSAISGSVSYEGATNNQSVFEFTAYKTGNDLVRVVYVQPGALFYTRQEGSIVSASATDMYGNSVPVTINGNLWSVNVNDTNGPIAVTLNAPNTLDPSNKGANVTLSSNNGQANSSAGSGSARSLAHHLSGKFGNQFVIVNAGTSVAVGIGNAGASLSAALGSDANSVAYFPNGTVVLNGTTIATIATYATGYPMQMAVDLTNKLIWFYVAGQWNNSGTANPATGVGGISIAGLNAGPYYVMAYLSGAAAEITANFGPVGGYILGPNPAGFGNW